ncbi:hypothetical protein [Vibrio sp. Vb339]|uniref:hypothetical protein n=1 Tax=Vibrio sp. Vb339 TaxID=1192013 RepID=UPI001557DEC6|nr:hypothetical protein [Vibrio sp. Vb339]
MLDLSLEDLDKNVRRNKKYKHIEDTLVTKSNAPAFKYLKDLMIFSALLGLKEGVKESIDKESTSNGITLKTYSGKGSVGNDRSLGQHGLIFLIAMYEEKTMDVLRAEQVDKAIDIFEKYSNGGLSIISSWLKDSNNNPDVIINYMLELDSNNFNNKGDLDISSF